MVLLMKVYRVRDQFTEALIQAMAITCTALQPFLVVATVVKGLYSVYTPIPRLERLHSIDVEILVRVKPF